MSNNNSSISISTAGILTKEQIRDARLKKMGLPCSNNVDIPIISSSSSSPSILSNSSDKKQINEHSSSSNLHLDKKQTLEIYKERLVSDYEIENIKRY